MQCYYSINSHSINSAEVSWLRDLTRSVIIFFARNFELYYVAIIKRIATFWTEFAFICCATGTGPIICCSFSLTSSSSLVSITISSSMLGLWIFHYLIQLASIKGIYNIAVFEITQNNMLYDDQNAVTGS